MNRTIDLFMLFAVVLLLSSNTYAENWTRSGYLTEKEWDGHSPLVFGVLKPSPGYNGCDGGDQVLQFDIEAFPIFAGSNFDVNHFYVDGVVTGEIALDVWLSDWQRRSGYGRELPPLGYSEGNNGMNWAGESMVQFCVGSATYAATTIPLTEKSSMTSIAIWYDGPVATTELSFPITFVDDSTMDLSVIEDALAVSGNGLTVSDLNGSGTETQPTESPQSGLPDFVVNHVWLTTVGGVEQYTYNITDEIKMNAQLENIGDDDIPSSEYVYTRFYLSKGYKEGYRFLLYKE